MAQEKFQNLRLGIFILMGTLFLIIAFYLVGKKRNLFGPSFAISAQFKNVSGLMPGNNVRFGGIDIGTVKSVEIISDSSINVVMVIDEKESKFIKKNAIASVGTDGLMGNKLVNISSMGNATQSVEEGDILQAVHPIEMDDMIRTLNETNKNIHVITDNLMTITDRVKGKNSLWTLLMDKDIAENVKNAIVNINLTGKNSAILTGNLKSITEDIKSGKGSIGALVTDTVISSRINQVIVKLELLSDSVALISGDIAGITKDLKEGRGTVGLLLRDTSVIHNLNQTLTNINQGAKGFSDNMEGLKQSFLLRKYFRKKEGKK